MKSKRNILKDLLILYVLCAVYVGFTNSQLSVAGALGSSLGVILVAIFFSYIFWLLRTLFTRTNPKPQFRHKLLKYSAVYICISLFATASNNYRNEKSSAGMTDEVKHNVSTFIGESLNEDVGFLQHTNLEFNNSNLGKFDRLIKAVLNDRITLNNEYVASIDNLGLERLFNANWMGVAGNISVAKDLLTESISITTKHYANTKYTVSEASINSKLNSLNLNVSQTEYEEFIGGVNVGIEKQSKRSELLFDSEMKLLDKYGVFVSFIKMTKDYWVAEDGVFIFQKQEYLVEFNRLVEEILLVERMQSQIMLDLRSDFVE